MASLTIMAGLVLMLMPSVASADGIAAFPNRLEVDNGLRGGVYERSITLQSDFDEPGVFELEPRGPIADWITIQTREGVELTELDAPPKERLSLQVVVTIPDDVPNGIYEGGLGALLVVDGETSGEGTGSGIRLGVVVPITIDITGEQMISANFLELIINDGEVGLPHRVTAVVQNTGNVGLAPDVLFEVLAEDEVIDTLEPSLDLVAPGETAQLIFNWETETQRPGAYTAGFSELRRTGPRQPGTAIHVGSSRHVDPIWRVDIIGTDRRPPSPGWSGPGAGAVHQYRSNRITSGTDRRVVPGRCADRCPPESSDAGPARCRGDP